MMICNVELTVPGKTENRSPKRVVVPGGASSLIVVAIEETVASQL
jgi:hypothetical protein